MATINDIKDLIFYIKYVGKQNLLQQGVELSEDASVVDIVDSISDIKFYDDFWDNYQEKGNKADYSYAFNGKGWNNVTFKPKYDIISTKSTTGMFNGCGYSGSLIELFENQGIVMDTSATTGFSNMFLSATKITEIPELVINNSGKAVTMSGAFGTCLALKKVSLDIQSSVSNWSSAFATCPELEYLNIKGTIDINGFDVHWSPKLNKASIKNIINCLSSTTQGLTVTLSLAAVNKAFETSEGALDGSSSEEWLTLIGKNSNWTVALS